MADASGVFNSSIDKILFQNQIWREKTDGSGGFEEEEKLEGHSDWVRDVAWAPSIGLPKTVIASCSQDQRVIIWTHDGSPGAQWSSKVNCHYDAVPSIVIIAPMLHRYGFRFWSCIFIYLYICCSNSTNSRM